MRRRRNGLTAALLAGLVVGMVGLAYASVPLYQWFCQVTGYGGTTRTASDSPERILDREITVRFNADVNSALAWQFQPEQRSIRVRVGERALAFYAARNMAGQSLTGTATFNVTPAKAGPYFNKIECFCFTEQTLEAGADARMPVSFYVDPSMVDDRNLDDVTTITLSYTFFRTEPPRGGQTAARNAAASGSPAAVAN